MPLQTFTEEMLTRLEEFENILTSTQNSADEAKSNITKIADQKEDLYRLCKRIDDVERLVEVMDHDLATMERVVSVAEDELDITEGKRITSLFRNMFKKSPSASNVNADGIFQPPPLQDPSCFFREPELIDEEVDQTAQDALLDSDFFNDVDTTSTGPEKLEDSEKLPKTVDGGGSESEEVV